MLIRIYRIRGTFDDAFNLAVWGIWLQLPNFTSENTDYSQMIPFMSVLLTLFAKLNAHQFALHSNSPNSNVPHVR